MAKVCVVPHSGAHARLSQLEQNGGDAADEYGHRIAEHTPTHGIGTEDAGIAGRLEIINVMSVSWRIGQAQDHSLQPYPRRTQEGHPVEARNRGCGRVLDSGHHRSPHYTDSATKGFYRIYQTSCRISFVAAGYWSDLGSMPSSRRTPVIQELPWPWHRMYTCCGKSFCDLTLKIRSGRIVTDSSSRLAMPPHYYIPCCT